MVNDEKYISFLKQIISCISHGDYYSVKELSQLELEKMKKEIQKQANMEKSSIAFKRCNLYNEIKKNKKNM